MGQWCEQAEIRCPDSAEGLVPETLKRPLAGLDLEKKVAA